MIAFKNRDVVSIKDFSREDIEFILKTAQDMEKNKEQYKELLKGEVVTLVFYESSTRTRLSTYMAAKNLGATIQPFLYSDGTSAIKGETLSDTITMLKKYGASIVTIRHPLEGSAQWAADVLDVPVINCGDGAHEHPTQTLLDLYTILKRKESLDNLTISFVGDMKYGRTVHSLALALTKFQNITFNFISPEILKLPQYLKEYLWKKGVKFIESTNINDGTNSDILYMTRIQEERFGDKREYEQVRKSFSLEPEHLVNPKTVVMHPLPRNKKAIEINPLVDALPQAGYMEQAENGVYTRMAILALVSGKIGSVETYISPEEEETEFEFKEISLKDRPKKEGGYLVWEMDSGTAIDHLESNTAPLIKEILKLPKETTCTIGVNLPSKKGDKKDILKIWNYQVNNEQMRKIGLFAPNATINLISEDTLRKTKVLPPKILKNLISCENPHCISNPENYEFVPSKFYRNKNKFICGFCGREKTNSLF
ncbi:aspartate carbamoyltransferase [archaeon]|jgi:aspartate carbamoyltransferase catalytic subunit|nr:aspartate carbamoyltransferase [archaeon]MBT4397409.1 aspartate carbamoyltransferase [archaeon]MBT4440481.1 aspartate carbamoyltransferase [archaeon]